MDAPDQTPLDQLAQIHAHVAARDAQPVHDVIHRQSGAGDIEQAVDLRHRRADAPERTHRSPQVDELILDFLQALAQVGPSDFHPFYSFQEDMKL